MTLEQLGEDQLFLVCHSVHVDSFALNRSTKQEISFYWGELTRNYLFFFMRP